MYVAAAIEDRQKALAGKLEITQEAVLAELQPKVQREAWMLGEPRLHFLGVCVS